MGYSSVTVFGDSLVDAGNALKLANWYGSLPFTETVDAAPWAANGYYDGRFTNGFTVVDLIANKYVGQVTRPIFPYGYEDPYIGLPIAPFASDPTGTTLNFAYGGAQMRHGDEAVPDLDGQTDAWRDAVDGHADPTGLYTFSFGANDVHDLVPKTGAWADVTTATKALQAAAEKYVHEIMQVIGDGATNILIIGVPDIGIQPYYDGLADEAGRRLIGTQYSQMLDQMVQAELAKQQLPPGLDLQYVGFKAMQDYVLGEMAQIYGAGSVNSLEAGGLVFFDTAHPTTQIHALAAGYLIDQLNGVPSGDQPGLITPDYRLDAAIGAGGEVDSIIISLAATSTYTLQMLGLSTLGGDVRVLADPQLRVLSPSASIFAYNDDGAMGLDASLTFTSAGAGDYIVQLSGCSQLTGSYTFLADGIAPGDDTYFVSHSSALILEKAGEGVDTVKASVSYALAPDTEIEVLRTSQDKGKGALNLTGNDFAQMIVGNAGANMLEGMGGSDALQGGGGDDRLSGGAAKDVLTGGTGADTFLFDDGDFGGMTGSTAERLTDFSQRDHDRIDLSAVDANSLVGGDQAFSFIGSDSFHNVAGELRFLNSGGNTWVYGDTNGDGTADFVIRVDGTFTLVGADFGL